MKVRDEELFAEFLEKVKTARMSRRKFLGMSAAGTAAMAAGLITGCGPRATPTPALEVTKPPAEKPVLNMAQWGGLWLEIIKEQMVAPFEEEHNCTINIDTAYPFWPKMAAAPLENPPLDIINDNLPHSFRMQDAGMLFTPDEIKENVPNAADFWPFAFKGTGVIHGWSPYGIGYRKDLVDPPPTKYMDMWESRFDGKRGTYTMPNTLGVAFLKIASMLFGKDEYDYDAGLEALGKAAPWKLADFTTQMTGLLERGEIVVANIHDADIYQQADQGLPFDFARCSDAPTAVLCQNISVAKYTKYPELAFEFLNFFLGPERHVKLLDPFYMRPGHSTEKVSEQMAAKGVKNTPDEIEGLWIPDWHEWNQHEAEITERYNEIMI